MSANAAKGKFHQFPLALLAFGKNAQDKLNAMTAYAIIDSGKRAVEKMGGAEAVGEIVIHKTECGDFDEDNLDHCAWAFGKDIVHLNWGDSPLSCVELYRACKPFLDAFGPSPFVRVNSKLMEETHKGQFPFRDLSVLLAVYAIIGDKSYTRILRDRVRAGALGYSSNKALFDRTGNVTENGKTLLARRGDRAEPLTVNQCRYTLDHLHDRNWFSRFQPKKCGRTVYYSRSLSHEDLAKVVFARMVKRKTAAAAQNQAQEMFREKANALLKRWNSGESASVEAIKLPPEHSPHDHR